MRNVWIICRKELRSYFASPVAYLLLTMFGLDLRLLLLECAGILRDRRHGIADARRSPCP